MPLPVRRFCKRRKAAVWLSIGWQVTGTITEKRRIHVMVAREGFVVNYSRQCMFPCMRGHKKVRRIYREERLQDRVIAERGMPKTIVPPLVHCCAIPCRARDNGTEFTSMAILKWVQETGNDNPP